MEYFTIFTDFLDATAPLSDAETGRLIRAMAKYAKHGTAPNLSGNERFVWPSEKLQIDRQKRAYENKVAGAAKARAKKSLDIKSDQEQSRLIGFDTNAIRIEDE